MALLRKIAFDGHESDVQNFVAGDNVAFVPQPDGNIQINAAGGGGGSSYVAGEGIKISPQNVISADVRSDMLAPTEVNPAEDPHAVGEFIIVDGVQYRVTAAIAVGDALVEGTNIERRTMSSVIAPIAYPPVEAVEQLNTYTSAQNAYTCPEDGYVVLRTAATSPMGGRVCVDGIPMLSVTNSTNYSILTVFVRRGAKVHVESLTPNAYVVYYKFTTY